MVAPMRQGGRVRHRAFYERPGGTLTARPGAALCSLCCQRLTNRSGSATILLMEKLLTLEQAARDLPVVAVTLRKYCLRGDIGLSSGTGGFSRRQMSPRCEARPGRRAKPVAGEIGAIALRLLAPPLKTCSVAGDDETFESLAALEYPPKTKGPRQNGRSPMGGDTGRSPRDGQRINGTAS